MVLAHTIRGCVADLLHGLERLILPSHRGMTGRLRSPYDREGEAGGAPPMATSKVDFAAAVPPCRTSSCSWLWSRSPSCPSTALALTTTTPIAAPDHRPTQPRPQPSSRPRATLRSRPSPARQRRTKLRQRHGSPGREKTVIVGSMLLGEIGCFLVAKKKRWLLGNC